MTNTTKKADTPVKPEKPSQSPMDVAAKKIKNAWVAGLISVGVTFAFVLISFAGESVVGVDAWAFIDTAIMLGLSYGVYRKSRACAVLLFAFFITTKLIMWGIAGNVSGLPVALVFMWFFAQGIMGTFQHHKLQRDGQGAA